MYITDAAAAAAAAAFTCLARSTSAPGLSILLIATMMGTSAACIQQMHVAYASGERNGLSFALRTVNM
jgi:hypothetical protein